MLNTMARVYLINLVGDQFNRRRLGRKELLSEHRTYGARIDEYDICPLLYLHGEAFACQLNHFISFP